MTFEEFATWLTKLLEDQTNLIKSKILTVELPKPPVPEPDDPDTPPPIDEDEPTASYRTTYDGS